MRVRPAAQHRPARRLALSLVVALALHGLVLWLFRNGWFVLQQPVPQQEQITIKLVEPHRTTPPPPPPPTIQHGPPSPRQRITERVPAGTPEAAPSPAPPVPAAPPPSGSPPGPALAQPDRAPPAPPATEGAQPNGIVLFPSGVLAREAAQGKQAAGGTGNGSGHGTGPGEGDSNTPEAERQRVKGRVDGDLAAMQAHNRVDAGLVDPYFHRIGETMRQTFRPRPSQIGGTDGDGAKAGLKNLAQGWASVGKQWAKTGSPYPDGEGPAGLDNAHPQGRAAGGTSGFDPGDFMTRWNNGEFAFSGGVVLVELTQDNRGHTLDVSILQSSGFKLFDQAAKTAIAEAAEKHPPPAHGLGLGGSKIQSVWKLEARLVPNTCAAIPDTTGVSHGAGVVPGIMCGGTFDPSLGVAEFDAPLQTRVITKVNLLAVYGGESGPVPAPALAAPPAPAR